MSDGDDRAFREDVTKRLSRIEVQIGTVIQQQSGFERRLIPVERFIFRAAAVGAGIGGVVVAFAQPIFNLFLG